MPNLCSMLAQRASLRAPRAPSGFTRNFGTRNSESPRVPGGARLDRVEVGARLRLRQVHRAGPVAADHLAHVNLAQSGRAVGVQGAEGAFAQQRTEREAHRGSVPNLGTGEIDGVRQAHPAIFRRGRDPGPARFRPAPVDFAKPRRRSHAAVFVTSALEIADAVERRDRLGREPAGLADHGGHGLPIEFAEQARADLCIQAGDMLEGKQDIGDRRLIGHCAPPLARSRRVGPRSLPGSPRRGKRGRAPRRLHVNQSKDKPA